MAQRDVIIVGGGVMGSSLAYHLGRREPGLRLTVVERDPTYAQASSTLSMANVRLQHELKANVQISLHAMEVFAAFAEEMAVGDERPEIAFRQEGNLFLIDQAGRARAEREVAMQRELGGEVEWWDPTRIRERYPLYEPAGYVGGTFGASAGHLDAFAVLMGYKAKARAQGVEFLAAEAGAVLARDGRVTGVRLAGGGELAAPVVANCAGAWCAELAKTCGVDLPVIPVKRQVFVLDTKVKPAGPLPLTILPSGLYFRTETGGLILLGKSLPEDPVGFDFAWDRERFLENLWPELAEFVPAFDTARLMRGWAGLYAMSTLDGDSLLGEWPELKGFWLANGFSGHGLQQAPAVGRYLAELILGLTPSLDLAIFSPRRVLDKRPIARTWVV